jgi:hypothetical protein
MKNSILETLLFGNRHHVGADRLRSGVAQLVLRLHDRLYVHLSPRFKKSKIRRPSVLTDGFFSANYF